jgi:hypothetical protein
MEGVKYLFDGNLDNSMEGVKYLFDGNFNDNGQFNELS